MLTQQELSGFWQTEVERFIPDPEKSLEEAFQFIACPVCHTLSRLPFEYGCALPARWAEEATVREVVCRAGGFCNRHTWRMADLQSDRALARIYRDVLSWLRANNFAADLQCPICRLTSEADRRLLEAFARYFASAERRQRYPRIFGLCYRHLTEALSRELDGTLRIVLLETEAAKAKALARNGEGYLAKDSVQGKWTRTHDENRAPRHALVKTAGDDGA